MCVCACACACACVCVRVACVRVYLWLGCFLVDHIVIIDDYMMSMQVVVGHFQPLQLLRA